MKRFHVVLSGWIVLFIFGCRHASAPERAAISADSLGRQWYEKGLQAARNYQIDSAYYYYNQAILYANRAHDSLTISKASYNMARIDAGRQFYNLAEFHAVRALRHNKAGPKHDLRKGLIYNILGLINIDKNLYAEAEKDFEKFRRLYCTYPDTLPYYLTYLNNTGLMYRKAGNWERAMERFDAILKTDSLRYTKPVDYARALHNKAVVLDKTGHEDEAYLLALEALDLRRKAGHRAGVLGSYLFLSELVSDMGNKKLGNKFAMQALETAEKISSPPACISAMERLMENDPSLYRIYFKRYRRLRDSLWEVEIRSKDLAMRTAFESAEKDALLRKKDALVRRQKLRWRLASILLLLTSVFLIFMFVLYRKLKQSHHRIRHQNKVIRLVYRDMHHRMQNFLDTSSLRLYRLKEALRKKKNYREALEEMESDLSIFKTVHERLKYQNLTHQPPAEWEKFLRELYDSLAQIFSSTPFDAEIHIRETPVLSDDRFVALVHIISEFIINAFKHTRPPAGTRGLIRIILDRKGPDYRLRMESGPLGREADDGKTKDQKGAGLTLIRSLHMELDPRSIRRPERFKQEINKGFYRIELLVKP